MTTYSWFKSIRLQIGFAVLVIFFVLAGSLAYTSHALKLRQHDYLILNLTGQLRVLSQTMAEQARHYAEQAPDDDDKYNRDLGIYWQDLQKQTALYDRIVRSLETRQIDAGLTGNAEHNAIYCTWDDQSTLQMSKTAAEWKLFKEGLDKKLGEDLNEPRLTWAAEYIDEHGNALIQASESLARAFQLMMERKVEQIRIFQWVVAGVGVLLLFLVLFMIQQLIIKPLNTTLDGFGRVAKGDFSYQLPMAANNEIGQMSLAFNFLTRRLKSMFSLTDRINQGHKLDDMLRFLHSEFQTFVPLDWVGVFYASPDGKTFLLERQFSPTPLNLNDGDSFSALQTGWASIENEPLALSLSTIPITQGGLEEVLVKNGFTDSVYLPLLSQGGNRAIMTFASKNKNYQIEHVEFLKNIVATISHILERTVVMENLVASAVQGLAKLAESKDPETGDHLVRMAHYSALIAEELRQDPKYKSIITPAYVRDVYHFAPMHDIGKVGIPDYILLKPGRLDVEERKRMEHHPIIGGDVLRRCEAQMVALGHSMFQIGIEIAEHHHEKFDGTGYPKGLREQEIPLSARIVAVADVFDALTSKRPYKDAWPIEKALTFMQADIGSHFDPDVMAAMLRAMPRISEVYARLKHV